MYHRLCRSYGFQRINSLDLSILCHAASQANPDFVAILNSSVTGEKGLDESITMEDVQFISEGILFNGTIKTLSLKNKRLSGNKFRYLRNLAGSISQSHLLQSVELQDCKLVEVSHT